MKAFQAMLKCIKKLDCVMRRWLNGDKNRAIQNWKRNLAQFLQENGSLTAHAAAMEKKKLMDAMNQMQGQMKKTQASSLFLRRIHPHPYLNRARDVNRM
jgi:hypothetical protein